MLNTNLDTVSLNESITRIIASIHNEFIDKNMQLSGNPEEVAAFIAFEIGRDYYKGARLALDDERLLTGTSAVRSGMENVADLFHIYIDTSKSAERAKAYVDSVSTYHQNIIKAKLDLVMGGKVGDFSLKQVNDWTTSKIAHRIKAAGVAISTTYDMMSYFSHPNPAAITYLGTPRLLKKQINLVHQANCVGALTLCMLTIRHSKLMSVSPVDLDSIGSKLGLGKFQDVT